MKNLLLLFFLLAPFTLAAQSHQSVDTVAAPASTENIYSKPLYSDSLSSSFVIVIKKEVKKHLHQFHTEQVYVISGEGEMILGDKTIHVKAGDVIFIPKNTPHAVKVTSAEPLKIISVQAPYFDGKDRVLLEK
jgi:mannose-6-phosphate isomerase-like protein (cupin superfamily)